jgi:site-specific recombinase XerD
MGIRRLRSVASMLIHIGRLMNLESLRTVELCEVEDAAFRWTIDPHKLKDNAAKSAESFKALALRWFRFAQIIGPPVTVKTEHDTIIEEFREYLVKVRGLAPETIRSYITRSDRFLEWLGARHALLRNVRIADVEAYLREPKILAFRVRTKASICSALREFFRYSLSVHLTESNVWSSISRPHIPRYDTKPRGPKWRDVRRLLNHDFGTKPADLRAKAILALCAIYAMRRCEIVALTLDDFDWITETLTVRRAKSRRVQQFPIQFEVGQIILHYLRLGRPRCTCRNLFVTLTIPYRPMGACSTWQAVATRMNQLGIKSENFGVHSLRHSCATHLLQKGSSLKEIADFLGHSDMKSVSIYAKHDMHTLRQVAAFSLAGVR